MTVKLVSSRCALLSDFVCFDWHLAPLRGATAILIDIANKIALLAMFKAKEQEHMFVQNLCFYILDDMCLYDLKYLIVFLYYFLVC